jgi:hypothetical protein
MLKGRPLSAEDRLGGPLVLVINEALARSYFAGEDPIGQRMTFNRVPNDKSNWYTIVGVVADEHFESPDKPVRPAAYASFNQDPANRVQLILRTTGDPLALVNPANKLVREFEPSTAVTLPNALDEVVSKSLARIRFLTTLMLSFAFVGLTMAVIGVYGVLAHSARNRTREMGIRMALGARGSAVRWLVVRDGLRLTLIGLVVGMIVARIATPLMSALLYDTSPHDVVSLAAMTLLIALTSLAAAWLPAYRASLVDPTVALRAD